jgi:hypothetical protein
MGKAPLARGQDPLSLRRWRPRPAFDPALVSSPEVSSHSLARPSLLVICAGDNGMACIALQAWRGVRIWCWSSRYFTGRAVPSLVEFTGLSVIIGTSRKLRLILHIGPPKTGTTSLQRALRKTYSTQKPKEIWYPRPTEYGPGHALMALDIMQGLEPSVRRTIDEAARANCKTLILSSENFAKTAFQNRIEVLAEQTSAAQVHVVATLSPIYQRAVSTWQQGLRVGTWNTPIEKSLEKVVSRPGLRPDLIEQFAEHFPAAKVSVLITSRSSPQDLFLRFSAATGIGVSPLTDGSVVENTSLGWVEAETLRAFNFSAEAAGLAPNAANEARKLLRKLVASEEWRSLIPPERLRLPDGWTQPLAELTAETIRRLRALASQGRIEIFGEVDCLDDGK